jgi:hypothetical protein
MRSCYFLIVGMALTCAVRGQSIEKMVYLMGQVEHFTEAIQIHHDFTDSTYDSLTMANTAFRDSLLRYASAFSKTLPIPELGICTSEDGRFRIYTWDSGLGGKAHTYWRVYQFYNDGKVKTRAGLDPESGSSYSVEKIFTLSTEKGTWYLSKNDAITDILKGRESISAYAIMGDSVNDTVGLFQT